MRRREGEDNHTTFPTALLLRRGNDPAGKQARLSDGPHGKGMTMGKEAKPKRGRPTKHREEYNEQAYKLCLLGATDAEIGDFFGVPEQTVNNWKHTQPSFLESITRGKVQADAEVAEKLRQRALGYSHPDTHISTYNGEVTITPIIKHYPPDTPAASLWLRNRQPKKWRDKVDVEHSGKTTVVIGKDDAECL